MHSLFTRAAAALVALLAVALGWEVRSAGQPHPIRQLAAPADGVAHASVETTPVPHDGDAADDAAVWVDPHDPGRSTVIGTDKKGGLAVYDLDGRQLFFYGGIRPNN